MQCSIPFAPKALPVVRGTKRSFARQCVELAENWNEIIFTALLYAQVEQRPGVKRSRLGLHGLLVAQINGLVELRCIGLETHSCLNKKVKAQNQTENIVRKRQVFLCT